jgi:hypothetical protein
VLTRDVRLEGFSTADWMRLGEALRPPRRRSREPEASEDSPAPIRPRGGVVAVASGERLRKLLSTERGRLDVEGEPWPQSPQELAARHRARWALELSTGALEELMDRFAERLRREHDLTAQFLILLGALRELEGEGRVSAFPWQLARWPVPSERMVLRAFDAFCPDGKSVLFGVFDAGELATCLAARRSGPGFDWIMGPELLRLDMGLISGDWTRDYRHLARAVEQRLGPLAVGCHGEMATFRQLAEHSAPGAWAAAVAARDVILSPVSPALAIPLGVDVGRAAVATVRELAERTGFSAWLTQQSLLSPAFERVQRFAAEHDLSKLLGFDPFAALRALLSGGRGSE